MIGHWSTKPIQTLALVGALHCTGISWRTRAGVMLMSCCQPLIRVGSAEPQQFEGTLASKARKGIKPAPEESTARAFLPISAAQHPLFETVLRNSAKETAACPDVLARRQGQRQPKRLGDNRTQYLKGSITGAGSELPVAATAACSRVKAKHTVRKNLLMIVQIEIESVAQQILARSDAQSRQRQCPHNCAAALQVCLRRQMLRGN